MHTAARTAVHTASYGPNCLNLTQFSSNPPKTHEKPKHEQKNQSEKKIKMKDGRYLIFISICCLSTQTNMYILLILYFQFGFGKRQHI